MYSYIGEEMSKALKLAKECGIRDNIHDDAAMDYISNARIETFYRRAKAQALRDAGDKLILKAVGATNIPMLTGSVKDYLYREAAKLESKK
jgi:ribosomal protein L17